uniref:Gelsolin-like n=1 Tax=Salarias fasciatus TaxID=181472 RepID=A0A672IP73_SALFA
TGSARATGSRGESSKHRILRPCITQEETSAGKKPGLQVWRVENMELVPVPPLLHGEFFTGDSYVLLYTAFTCKGTSYSLHSWRGSQASQDEYGAAAILMTQLDDCLGGAPRQYLEFQGQESTEFLSYFKHGIRYKNGGVASGFNHTEINPVNMKRVLHVKGRRNIRASEVELSWDSFNKGDCFIIDLGKVIYHWSGSKSNFFERLKSTELAKDIRDNERQGRSVVEMVVEGSETSEIINILGPKPDLPEATSDKPADRRNSNKATLYLISDAAGVMEASVVAEQNPFSQDSLSSNDCYILDNGPDNKVFVWKGKNANKNERRAAFAAAHHFILDKGYSPNTQVQVMPAGAESTLFKQFFLNWLDKDETTGPSEAYTIGSIARVEQIPFDAASLHTNKAMAAQHGMVDDGSGKTQIWRVEGSDKVPVDEDQYGQFYGGDCYLILYSYNTGGREKHIIYTWQGLKCSRDELAASAFLTVNLDDSMGGVRVTQGKEPAHLVSLFKAKPLVIYLGGTCRHGGDSTPGSTRLFHIRESSTEATRAVEVDPGASSLNSNDVFVLSSLNSVTIWKGHGATAEEMDAARYVAGLLGGAPTEVEETQEPDEFWAALGGKADYQTSITLRNAVSVPRLFACSNKTGNLIVEEVPGELAQSDLAPDDVMILDIYRELFVWIGKDANEQEIKGSSGLAEEYLKADPSCRTGVPITTMKQGEELPTFTGWFHAWDPNMWDKARAECMHH